MAQAIREASERIAEGAHNRSIRAALIAAEGTRLLRRRRSPLFRRRRRSFRRGAGRRHGPARSTRPPDDRAGARRHRHPRVGGWRRDRARVGRRHHGRGFPDEVPHDLHRGRTVPDCGKSWLLPARIGLARALNLTMTNRVVGAEETAQWEWPAGSSTTSVKPETWRRTDPWCGRDARAIQAPPVVVGDRWLPRPPRSRSRAWSMAPKAAKGSLSSSPSASLSSDDRPGTSAVAPDALAGLEHYPFEERSPMESAAMTCGTGLGVRSAS